MQSKGVGPQVPVVTIVRREKSFPETVRLLTFEAIERFGRDAHVRRPYYSFLSDSSSFRHFAGESAPERFLTAASHFRRQASALSNCFACS